MKQIIELKRNLANHDYFMAQFDKHGTQNILFVNPSLSGKYLYKMLLPALKLPDSQGIATALTSLSDFSVYEQLVGYNHWILSPRNISTDQVKMIEWADRIIFPFAAQPLIESYDHIRSINPSCKVEFCIDFNCWELPDGHPLKEMFDEERVLDWVCDNMYFADAVLVSNEAMRQYLVELLTILVNTTYKGVERVAVNAAIEIVHEPTIISEEVAFENVDYEPKDIIFKVPMVPVETVIPIEEKTKKLPITKPVVVINKKKNNKSIKKVIKKTPKNGKKRKKLKKSPIAATNQFIF